MRTRLLPVWLACAAWSACGVASAQTSASGAAAAAPPTQAVPASEGDASKASPTPAASAAPAAAAAEGKEAKAPEESEKLKKFKAMKLDRRPTAILKAWADGEARKAGSGLDQELAGLAADVAQGRWSEVGKFIQSLPEAERAAAYERLLDALGEPPSPPQNPIAARFPLLVEPQTISPADFAGIVEAAPTKWEKKTLEKLGKVLASALADGALVDGFLVVLRRSAAESVATAALGKRGAALVLFAAGRSDVAAEFLPSIEEAEGANDRQALNLWAQHALALHARDSKPAHLELAWRATSAAAKEPPAKPVAPSDETPKGEVDKPKDPKPASATPDGKALDAAKPDSQSSKEKTTEKSESASKGAAPQPPVDPAAKKRAEAEEAARKAAEEDEAERKTALVRAVELAPRLPDDRGKVWLKEGFTASPARGRDILAAVGSQSAQAGAEHPTDPSPRIAALKRQRSAVEILLESAPQNADPWKRQLTLLASNWLREAMLAVQLGLRKESSARNPWGQPEGFGGGSERPVPAALEDLLQCMPHEPWLALVDENVRPKFAELAADLHLRNEDEAAAFPYIELLAKTNPLQARDLAKTFVEVWTKTHDPNESRRPEIPYYFMYGFEWRKEAIPLTRSKQERNLVDLEKWVKRLRSLPVEPIDEALLAEAFAKCHSSAEVFRLDAIEKVLGKLDSLPPKVLAQLVQQTRQNLAGVWRSPKEQDAKKTNRKQKDIEREVLNGYELARKVVARGLEVHPGAFALLRASAALRHDQASYRRELEKNPGFSKNQSEAFEEFAQAAAAYRAKVADLPKDEQSIDLYEQWFYASLGACDASSLDDTKAPDLSQPAKIRAALQELPEDAAGRHLEQFAARLFEKAATIKPAVKVRYLRAGFEIVGDHPKAREARKLFDYYKDLNAELKLTAAVDGDGAVGGGPFGVFVSLLHTREIERESGGFSRYLQNQNKATFAFNYGRPTEDYLDRFQEMCKNALGEQFEIVSVTFSDENVHSRSAEEYGWRKTPYAYLLLKPRGPQVDRIPSLRLDFDFMDTTGYVVLPVESQPVSIDASSPPKTSPPLRNVEVVQILDERQAAEGELSMEVKATALGLVPELKEILDFAPPGFEVLEVKDEGVAVVRLDSETDEVAPSSQRNWRIRLRAKPGLTKPPAYFAFGASKIDGATMVHQRYVDADLVTVDRVASLESSYGRPSLTATLAFAAVGLAALLALAVGWRRLTRKTSAAAPPSALPAEITPFTVLGLLRQAERNTALSPAERTEAGELVRSIESHYFVSPGEQEPDLAGIARDWAPRSVPPRPTRA